MEKKSYSQRNKLTPAEAEKIRSNPPRVMSVLEAAAYLGISPRLLRDYIARDRVKTNRFGRRIVIQLKALDRLLEDAAI